MFENKSILITGGTGSFGSAMIRRLLNTKISKIVVLSRDEKKQNDLREKISDSRLHFVIADVRDFDSIKKHFRNIDAVFHAAALKQVPSCELFPTETIKTNYFGTKNVLDAAIESNVKNVVCLSTDKAVYPVNAMGLSKAMMEKIAISKSQEAHNTIISITRYGNVLASRGSVVPLFLNQARVNKPLTITDNEMSRFIMSLEEAIELVIYALNNSDQGSLFVKKSPACKITDLADAIIDLTNSLSQKKITGIRLGEKRYETLLTQEEMANSIDMGDYYKIPSRLHNSNKSEFNKLGFLEINQSTEYNSLNAILLSKKEIMEMLKKTYDITRLNP